MDAAFVVTIVISQLPTTILENHLPFQKLSLKVLDYSFLHMFRYEGFLVILTHQHEVAL